MCFGLLRVMAHCSTRLTRVDGFGLEECLYVVFRILWDARFDANLI